MNGNMLRTGKCRHCGKTKEEHHFYDGANMNLALFYCSRTGANQFFDSGLAALDAHKEELWGAVNQFTIGVCTFGKAAIGNAESFQKLAFILNQIEKEK